MNIDMYLYYKTRKLKQVLFKTGYVNKPNDTSESMINSFTKTYNKRKDLIFKLITKYNITNNTILDLCSGFGQDSILFSLLGNNIVDSVEFDKNSCKLHKNMIKSFNVNNTVYNRNMLRFNGNHKYDIIYTSSAGNWMNEKRNIGIPKYFLKVVKNNCKINTLFICLLYGGNYTFKTSKEVNDYIPLLKNKCLDILDCNLGIHGLLIVSKIKPMTHKRL